MPNENLHERLARQVKAVKLADILEAAKIPAMDICKADDAEWALLAEAAQVKLPSTATRKLVIDLLQARAVARQRVAGPLPDDLERTEGAKR